MSKFYIREAMAANWTVTSAATLGAAKRAAGRAQMVQGTDLYVGQEIDGRVYPVAVKRADALDMRQAGKWVELDPDDADVRDIAPAAE